MKVTRLCRFNCGSRDGLVMEWESPMAKFFKTILKLIKSW